MKLPEWIETNRLILRRPLLSDAESIFNRYATDPEVTRYLAWPRHGSLKDTETFLNFSDSEWELRFAGPYLIETRARELLGSTGVEFKSPQIATTGYLLAKDAWGKGYATEALRAIVALVAPLKLERFYTLCHPQNTASMRVLEKCGFVQEGVQRAVFPNLSVPEVKDCPLYVFRSSMK